MEARENKKNNKRAGRYKGGEEGAIDGAREVEEREGKTWKIIRIKTRSESEACRRWWGLKTHRKDYRHKDQGWRSHSHVEDGLLVSHHLSISDCQGVVATLQVKILKCQFDYLDSRWSITTVTISDGRWNASDMRCRGEPSFHLRPSTSVHTRLSSSLKKIINMSERKWAAKKFRKRLKINTRFCLSCQMRILFVK